MTYERELPTDAAHALTHNQEVWSDHGWAVVTAGGLTSGSNALQLDVGEYEVLTGGTSSTTVGPASIDAQLPTEDPYWLVVYVDGSGTLQTATGPEGTVAPGLGVDVREISSPPPPTLASEGPVTVLGRALVTSDGIADSRIDDRVFSSERVFDTIAARSASVGKSATGMEWTEFTSSRSFDTWEQAPSDSDIEIAAAVEAGVDATEVQLVVDINDTQAGNGLPHHRFTIDQFGRVSTLVYTVPAGHFYRIRALGDSADYSKDRWWERR